MFAGPGGGATQGGKVIGQALHLYDPFRIAFLVATLPGAQTAPEEKLARQACQQQQDHRSQ
jgi:hypothetical protein